MGIFDRLKKAKQEKDEEYFRKQAERERNDEIKFMREIEEMPKKYRKQFSDALKMVEKECAKIIAGGSSSLTPESLRKYFETTSTISVRGSGIEADVSQRRVRQLNKLEETSRSVSQIYEKCEQEGKAAYKKAVKMLNEARQKAAEKKAEDDRKKKEQEKKAEEDKKKKEQEDKNKVPKESENPQTDNAEDSLEEYKEPTFEERRAAALEEVEKYVGNDPQKIRTIFLAGAGQDCLSDPEIACEIIKEYPQSIKNVPNDFVAQNLDEVTDSFVEGVTEICEDPNENRDRFFGGRGPLEQNRDGSLVAYDKSEDVRLIMQDTKDVFVDKMNNMCQEAAEIIDEDKNALGDLSKYKEVNTSQLGVSPQTGEKEFKNKIDNYKDQAKVAASVISGEFQI